MSPIISRTMEDCKQAREELSPSSELCKWLYDAERRGERGGTLRQASTPRPARTTAVQMLADLHLVRHQRPNHHTLSALCKISNALDTSAKSIPEAYVQIQQLPLLRRQRSCRHVVSTSCKMPCSPTSETKDLRQAHA